MKKVIGILIIIILAVLIWFGFFYTQEDQKEVEKKISGEITSFYLAKPNLVAETTGLQSVSFFATPADRSMEDYLLGEGILVEEFGKRKVWTLEIPEPILIRKIYAIGTDEGGLTTERLVFPIAGITEISNAFWDSVKKEEFELGVGESHEFGEKTFVLEKVLEDSRCPITADCIQEGRVVVEVSIDGESFVIASNEEESKVSGGYIKILNVDPYQEGVEIKDSEYEITFLLVNEPKK